MAVLIEGISVVIRTETLLKKYPGGWDAFLEIVPNKTLCFDDELTRVGFMNPQDVGAFVKILQQAGLEFSPTENAVDLVVVDQFSGPTTQCDWIEGGYININSNGDKVAACKLAGSQSMKLFTPNDWKYEGSLSNSHKFVANEDINKKLIFLRTENGVDVFLDKDSGKELYIGRTSDN